ncbi:hypothetical protein B0I37DRAFT_410986 [Chaetomium sp. MPI-CAGE-AT-0009]|nr:hypothetical protein B0I37DRAFT_410986 [Chaetomium sp. MPI-CAGE-AT-0009]
MSGHQNSAQARVRPPLEYRGRQDPEQGNLGGGLDDNWRGIETLMRPYTRALVPRFLAHVTGNGSRVIGSLLEHIPGAREAGPADLAGCRSALERLHALGIAKGGMSQHSFSCGRTGGPDSGALCGRIGR